MSAQPSPNGKQSGKSKEPLTLVSPTVARDRPAHWQLLSVQEFFSQCNWQGQRLEIPTGDHPEPTDLLTLPVGEFFRLLPWDGTPAVGSVPKASPVAITAESDPTEVTLNELLDLF